MIPIISVRLFRFTKVKQTKTLSIRLTWLSLKDRKSTIYTDYRNKVGNLGFCHYQNKRLSLNVTGKRLRHLPWRQKTYFIGIPDCSMCSIRNLRELGENIANYYLRRRGSFSCSLFFFPLSRLSIRSEKLNRHIRLRYCHNKPIQNENSIS